MKGILLAISATLLLSGTAAAQQTEETCKAKVDVTISTLEKNEQQAGQDQSLKGLTKKDIQEMLKTKTYCEVAQEIYKLYQNPK